MKLLTKEIEKKLPAIYATENVPLKEKNIICKFVHLTSCEMPLRALTRQDCLS